MRTAILLALIEFIPLTGPDDQIIFLDKSKVTTLRAPRTTEHFAPGTNCIVFTVDGKNINVKETCDQIQEQLQRRIPQ